MHWCTYMHMTRKRLSFAAFPVLLIAPSLLVAALTAVGLAPPLAMTVAVVALIVVTSLLERARPFNAEWLTQPASETRTDLAYIALASLPDRLTRVAIEAAVIALLAWSSLEQPERGVAESLGFALLAFVLADLGKYLIHRASHVWPWLWRFHLAHHQPARLTALNALRLHPVNLAYNAAIDTLPLVLLGVAPQWAALLATLRATVGVLQHANLDLEAGRQWLFNAPSYHRTHHDVDVQQANHNFASTLLVWDRLFGTLHRAPAPAHVGVASSNLRLPEGYLGQTLYPFCGERLATTCSLARFRWLVR